MEFFFETAGQMLNLFVQLIIIVVPVILAAFARNFIQGTRLERYLNAVKQVANAAIDYVENLDERGDLDTPQQGSKGLHKLGKASGWLKNEMEQMGYAISNDEAKRWVSSEFQNRMGGVNRSPKMFEKAKEAVDLLQRFEKVPLIDLPPEGERFNFLIGIGADWVVARLAEKGVPTTREEAFSWVRSEILNRLDDPTSHVPTHSITDIFDDLLSNLPPEEQLQTLAKQAVNYARDLERSGKLKLKPGKKGKDDAIASFAMGRLITRAGELGLEVSTDEIGQEIFTILNFQES